MYTLQTFRDCRKSALQAAELALADVLANGESGEKAAAQDALRELRRLQDFATGTAVRDTPAANTPIAVLASAVRNSTTASAAQTNTKARGLVVVLDLTAFTTTASLTLKVRRKNVDGTFTDLLTDGSAIAALGTYVFVLEVGAATGVGIRAASSRALPETWDVQVTHGNGNNHTYSVTAVPIR